jgi:hypothetical protein
MKTKLRVNGNKNIKHKNIKARLGITDKNNHSTFYMEGGAFITPNDEYDDFPEIMQRLESECKRELKTLLFNHSILSPDFLMNFEVCSDRMSKNKKTYLSFQYHFKQKKLANNSILDIKDSNEDFFINLLNDIEKRLTSYNIKVSKKRKCDILSN